MTDDNTDDTTLAQRVDQLEDRLDEALGYQQRVEQLVQQLARGQISRRAFLASMATVGAGAWVLSGNARADPEWQNATGNSGTEQTPLANIYAQDAYHQSTTTDSLRLATGQVIEDGSGQPRFKIQSNSTQMQSESGALPRISLSTNDSRLDFQSANSGGIRFVDNNGGFTAFKYTTSSSAPGTLELKNAELHPDSGITSGVSVYGTPTGMRAANIQLGSANNSDSVTIAFKNANGNKTAIGNESGEMVAIDDAGNKTTLT